MIENYTTYRVLKEFFDRPTKKFQLRELSRESGVSYPSVRNQVKKLSEKGLVEEVEEGTYNGYRASMNERFKLYKKLDIVRRLKESGLVELLKERTTPDAIVLFGSAARGEDVEKSDIDLLLVSGQSEINVEEFEEEFNREINLQFMTEEEIRNNKEFSNSLANGIVLDGYLVIK